MNEVYTISTDKTLLDINRIVEYLSHTSYWAMGRSKEDILRSIDNSMCFGVYENRQQVGFARVITDKAVFGWILDLFIFPAHQGKGCGKLLMKAIMNHEELQSLRRWGLNTKDAHELYKQFGFDHLADPHKHMEIRYKN